MPAAAITTARRALRVAWSAPALSRCGFGASQGSCVGLRPKARWTRGAAIAPLVLAQVARLDKKADAVVPLARSKRTDPSRSAVPQRLDCVSSRRTKIIGQGCRQHRNRGEPRTRGDRVIAAEQPAAHQDKKPCADLQRGRKARGRCAAYRRYFDETLPRQ
jgi:hypothetical protein